MARFTNYTIVLAFLVCSGCGQSTDTAQSSPSASPSTVADTSPTDIVSQFLDQVRRGGADSDAGVLLTSKARAVLKSIGRSVQPIGSPDAKFEVTRGEALPDDDNAYLVHSVWSEPNGNGEPTKFQVVWAVQKESVGWRISGLAMDLQPGMQPTIIDFENEDLMKQMLVEPEPQQNVAVEIVKQGTQVAGQTGAPQNTQLNFPADGSRQNPGQGLPAQDGGPNLTLPATPGGVQATAPSNATIR